MVTPDEDAILSPEHLEEHEELCASRGVWLYDVDKKKEGWVYDQCDCDRDRRLADSFAALRQRLAEVEKEREFARATAYLVAAHETPDGDNDTPLWLNAHARALSWKTSLGMPDD